MKEIPLSRGMVALVDDQDYEWLIQWKWCAVRRRQTYYATHWDHGTTVYMHSLIMGTPKGMETDHVDREGLHNWRGNLRVCTRGQNAANRQRQVNNTCGYKGVRQSHRRWRAEIQHNNKRLPLGYFDTVEEAAEAYDSAAREYFGEFAVLNL